VKKGIGEQNLLLCIAFGGIATTIGFCRMSGAGVATGSNTFNNCMGHTENFEVCKWPVINHGLGFDVISELRGQKVQKWLSSFKVVA
jgi:hypothetical protein